MNNVSLFNYCFGCGVCAASCVKNAISITLNDQGFYEPVVDNNKCVNCGICLNICSFNHKNLSLQDVAIRSWAAWSNDEQVRRKCSSGGIGFEIAKHFIKSGYKVVACRYNVEKKRAEHYVASTINELIQSTGSKYIQSYTPDAFTSIDKRCKYLVVGTPCQIDSFRHYIKKNKCEENFVLMDFFCHCVPSMLAWKAYTKMQEERVGHITYASWRNKFECGWHDSYIMGIDGEKTSQPIDWHDDYDLLINEKKSFIQSRKSQGDLFYKLFLGELCHGPQCEWDCKYKYDNSSADIRIGDLWGPTYKSDQKGVSALVSFTKKGESVIECLNDVTLVEHPFEVVAEGQMKDNAKSKELRPLFMYLLRKQYPLNGIAFKAAFFVQRVISRITKKMALT